MRTYDLIIIGGGPAGLTAGVYARRGGLNVLIVENQAVGGQMSRTLEIENYPGFPTVNGFQLAMSMQEQCTTLGVEFAYGNIEHLDLDGKDKKLAIDGQEYSSKVVIIATGTTPTYLNIKGEKEFAGRGVSYCAVCDGGFFKDKNVIVVGGGNTALEDAMYLQRFAKTVYLAHRRDEYRASKILVDKLNESNVKQLKSCVIDEIVGENKVTNVKVKNLKTNEISSINMDGVFVAVGQTPTASLFNVKKNERGYILVDQEMKTSIDGVFAAGDVTEKQIRQIVTACSDGAIAAESALKFLNFQQNSK